MSFDKIKIPTFAWSAFKYTAANLLNATVPILLLPVLTSYLSKEEYGLVSIFQVIVMIILPFIGFNSQSAVEREFFNAKTNFPEYLTNAIFLLLASGGFVLTLFLGLNVIISRLTDFPASLLWAIPVYCICHNLCEVLLSNWRIRDKATSYGLFRIGRTLLEIGLSVFFVVVAGMGMRGRIEAMLIAATVFSVLAIYLLHRSQFLTVKWNTDFIKDILRFGAPLIPHTLGGVIMIYSDRIFISKMLGMAETGSYTVGYQVAMAIYLLQSSFNLAWVPWFYKRLSLEENRTNQQIVKITYWYFLALMFCVLALTISSPLIFRIFVDQTYQDSIQFVFWIALGFGFDGMYKMVVNYIFYVKKTYIISFITLFTALTNLVLNYFFITWDGAIGASKATALCMFMEFIIVWGISNKIYPMPWFAIRKTQ